MMLIIKLSRFRAISHPPNIIKFMKKIDFKIEFCKKFVCYRQLISHDHKIKYNRFSDFIFEILDYITIKMFFVSSWFFYYYIIIYDDPLCYDNLV